MVVDGLASSDAAFTLARITTGSVTTLVAGAEQVGTAEIGSSAVLSPNIGSAAVVASKLASGAVLAANISGGVVNYSHLATNKLMTGSPPAGGLSMQTGQGTLGAGSDVWVAFPTAFKAAPKVVVIPDDSTLHYIATGSLNVGSFYAIGATATKTFSYIAVGSL